MADTIMLPEDLNATQSNELLAALRLRAGQPLTIDASAVTRVSTPVMQVLLSSAASWAAAGQEFSIVTPSPAFKGAAAILGISSQLLAMEGLPA